MNRHQLSKHLVGLMGLSLTVSWTFVVPLASAETNEVHWEHTGEKGAENWGNLSPDFRMCSVGEHQSPINLQSPINAKLNDLQTNYQNSQLDIINNGHTLQVNYPPESTLMINGESFELLQFHFHNPSEHQIEGKPFPLEAHLVHRNKEGKLAVLGVFIKEGRYNSDLKAIVNNLPQQIAEKSLIKDIEINAEQLLPKNRNYYHYSGSLTTPPCSENVSWFVFKEPIELSAQQINKITSIMHDNARPIQPLNQRFLLDF
jgi:carbonic anhydrase